MAEKPKRRPRCKWLGRDEDGRPYCEHGPAIGKHGGCWSCPMKYRETHREANRRYRQTEKYREKARLSRQSEAAKSARRAWYVANRERILEERRRQYRENRDARLAEQRKKYAEDTEYREKKKAAVREYVRSNPEVVRERKRLDYERNRERVLARVRAYAQSDAGREKIREMGKRRLYLWTNPDRHRTSAQAYFGKRRFSDAEFAAIKAHVQNLRAEFKAKQREEAAQWQSQENPKT